MNNRLIGILSDVFDVKKTDIHIDLKKQDLTIWDSLRQMDLITSLETEFDITFIPQEIVSMTSVRAIVKILAEKGIECES